MYFTKFTAQNYVCSGHFEEEYFDYSGRLQDKLDSQGRCADRHVKSKLTLWESISSTCNNRRMLKILKMRGPYSRGRGLVRENLLSWKKKLIMSPYLFVIGKGYFLKKFSGKFKFRFWYQILNILILLLIKYTYSFVRGDKSFICIKFCKWEFSKDILKLPKITMFSYWAEYSLIIALIASTKTELFCFGGL